MSFFFLILCCNKVNKKIYYVGPPITGISDNDWSEKLTDQLAPTPDWQDLPDPNYPENSAWGYKTTNVDGERVIQSSRYAIRLQWLHNNYTSLRHNANEEEVKKYTRAFIMEMLGSVMFPDKSADQVPVMYLQFIGDMDTTYNWGQAVLAFLYRQLYMACHANVKSVAGPLMLLQHWAWTRFPIGRPETGFNPARLGASQDPRKRLPFGIKWSDKYIRWPRNPHGGK